MMCKLDILNSHICDFDGVYYMLF